MKKAKHRAGIASLLFLFSILLTFSQVTQATPQKLNGLYVNTFGSSKNQSVIFVHGGPGYYSWDFELTTAQVLADEGFFVVVYDERGQGRSDATPKSDFNYRQYADDMKMIVDQLGLTKPILIGHSHGGPISLKFDQAYPGTVKSIVLVSAPVNFWGSFLSLLNNCSTRYASAGKQGDLDQVTFSYYQMALNPNPTDDEKVYAVGSAFYHGMQCGLYKTSHPTSSETNLRKQLKDNPVVAPKSGLSGLDTAMPGFLLNENYVRLNLVDYVAANKAHIFGIYGDEDGLFSPIELSVIRNILQQENGSPHFQLISDASHAIYIDQQSEFLKVFKQFAK